MNSSGFFNYPTDPQPESEPNRGSQFWATRPAEDWKILLNYVQTLRFSKGDIVTDFGQRDSSVYIISFGRFSAGEQAHVEGDALGILSFFDRQPQSQRIVADTEGELLNLTHDGLDALAAREPAIARAILIELGRILAGQLRN